MLLDIVILPSVEIRKKIGLKLEKEIGKFPHFFVVDNKKLIPHLSLWHLKTSKSKINDLDKKLCWIVKKQKPIKISTIKFDIEERTKYNTHFFVYKSKLLEAFQEKIFQMSYHFHIGNMPELPVEFGFKKWSGKKMEEAKKYGRPLGFDPHITAGWLNKEKDAEKVVEEMKNFRFSFLAKEIYICEVNKWWQVKRIIKKIKFI